MSYAAGIAAIIARIQGEWDHPDLQAFGPLSTDTLADVLAIAKMAQGIRSHQKPSKDGPTK